MPDGRWGEGKTTPLAPPTYHTIRFYAGDHPDEILQRGLTLAQAQAVGHDPETSSSTATSAEAVERTLKHGAWFVGYNKD